MMNCWPQDAEPARGLDARQVQPEHAARRDAGGGRRQRNGNWRRRRGRIGRISRSPVIGPLDGHSRDGARGSRRTLFSQGQDVLQIVIS